MKSPGKRLEELRSRYPLERDYQQEWEAIQNISEIRPIMAAASQRSVEFHRRLGQAIYRFRDAYPRLHDSDYTRKILEVAAAALEVPPKISGLIGLLGELDPITATGAMEFLKGRQKQNPHLMLPTDIPAAVEFLGQITQQVQLLATAVAFAHRTVFGSFDERALPYRPPTFALMQFWESLTGRAVAYPRTSGKGQSFGAANGSTAFIYLALKMIDAKVTLENAVTSIRACLDIKRKAYRDTNRTGRKMPRNATLQEVLAAYTRSMDLGKTAEVAPSVADTNCIRS